MGLNNLKQCLDIRTLTRQMQIVNLTLPTQHLHNSNTLDFNEDIFR